MVPDLMWHREPPGPARRCPGPLLARPVLLSYYLAANVQLEQDEGRRGQGAGLGSVILGPCSFLILLTETLHPTFAEPVDS